MTTFAHLYRKRQRLQCITPPVRRVNALIYEAVQPGHGARYASAYRRYQTRLPVLPTWTHSVPRTWETANLLQHGNRTFSASYRLHHVAFLQRLADACLSLVHPVARSGSSLPRVVARNRLRLGKQQGVLAPAYAFASGPSPYRRASSTATPTTSRLNVLLKLAGAGLLIYGVLDFLDRQEQQVLQGSDVQPLNDTTFVPFEITAIDQVSPTQSVFHLKHPAALPKDLMRPVASISVCDPSLNIQRPYTVLSHDAEQGILSILVKRYDDGDMSRFIHGKRVGGTLQLRAHPSAYIMPDYQARGIQQVMCVVGGTGVVVAIQLAEALLKQADTMPRVGIVYASRCRQERVLQDRLDAIVEQSNGHVTVRYVEDDTEGFVSQKHLQDALGLKSGWFKQPTADGNTTHVIVCGSDGFVAHIAGYKPERGQGEVGGLLAQMHLTQSVWKL